jgi:hypothetical protein
MAGRPTDAAIHKFRGAEDEAKRAAAHAVQAKAPSSPFDVHVAQSLQNLAQGMTNLSAGLRDVYILLEEVRQQQRSGRPQ